MTVAPADSTSRASTPPLTRPHHPHPRSYGMNTSHSRPFFDSKWNRQGVGRIRFGIEIHRFSQLSNQELAPIEMCPPDRGRGGGKALLSRANPVPIAPCFCSKSAGPHPNPPPQKGAGTAGDAPSLAPAPPSSMGTGRGGVSLCPAAQETLSRLRPASAGNLQGSQGVIGA